jgi:hypothetical protein
MGLLLTADIGFYPEALEVRRREHRPDDPV